MKHIIRSVLPIVDPALTPLLSAMTEFLRAEGMVA